MRYANDGGRPTRIDDDGVFASRTMLRLNIGLGSQQLYRRAAEIAGCAIQSFLSATVSTA